jgi:hypothetical protein
MTTSTPLSELVQAAKQRLPLPDLMRHLGLGEYAKASCRSPLREDNNPSWGIFHRDGMWLWKDHGTGEAGDEVTFLEVWMNLPRNEAMKRYCNMAGIAPQTTSVPESRKRGKPNIPEPITPNKGDIEALAALRNVSCESIEAACRSGILFLCDQSGHRAWGITDRTKQNAQVRRLDGKVWPEEWKAVGGKKAWTLKGSRAAWPIGAIEAASCPKVALVEGGPDLLAAFHFIHVEGKEGIIAPVSILGAGNHIPVNALPCFKGKQVRIFGHDDKKGQVAVTRWGHQLMDAGATVDAFSFSGLLQSSGCPVTDLNDLCQVSPEMLAQNPHLQEIMP